MSRFEHGLLSRGGKNPRGEMPFLEHLEELRWRILWSILAIAIGAGVGLALVYYFDVLTYLIAPAEEIFGEEWRLIYLSPTDAFFMFLKLGLMVGLILASPVLIYQIWAFLSPALEKHEKRAIVPALYMGLVLFALGVAMAYFIALPISLRFLLGFLTEFMEPNLEATRYIGFVVKLLLGFGIVFELPVVILILSALGLVTPAFLRSKRRHAIVIITVVASFLSPGDVIAVTILMMVPLIFLYEFSILLSVVVWRRREGQENTIVSSDAPEGSVSAAGTAVATAEASPSAGSGVQPSDTGASAPEVDVDPVTGRAGPYVHRDPAWTDGPGSEAGATPPDDEDDPAADEEE